VKPKLLLLLLFLLSAWAAYAQKPCDIKASIYEGCIPLPVQYNFSTTNTSNPVSYYWQFGDGDSSSQAIPTHIYKGSGKYYATVVVTFANGTKCTVTISKAVVVHSSPIADFNLKNNQQVILCSTSTPICFKDNSSPGTDKAPIKSWHWSYGDGSSSATQNPCYLYSDSGIYTVTLEVVDTNGCKTYIQKKIHVKYLSGSSISLTPKFNESVVTNCADNSKIVTITNTTDTSGKLISSFTWNFGDGTSDSGKFSDPSYLVKWMGSVHTYKKPGVYCPSLFIQNKLGCTASVSGGCITVKPYTIVLNVSPKQPNCFKAGSTVTYTSTINVNPNYHLWDFGDPYNRKRGNSALEQHRYPLPGKYTATYETQIGNCLFDSILCNVVVLYGPLAHITNGVNTVPPGGSWLIPPSTYYSYFDTSCFAPGSVLYYTYSPVKVTNGEAIYDSCRLDKKVITLSPDSLTNCQDKKYPDTISTYTAHINGYKDTVIMTAINHFWMKGNPYPTGNIYSRPPYVPQPFTMDDTSLTSVRCKAPMLTKFTNFSIKYRGYDAVDNYPLNYPDKCLHKAYPFASDSLSYFWNFKEGNPGTSTTANPDIHMQFSTEKLPTHLFQKDGCYIVSLVTSDPVTGCSDMDSIPVILQAANAGWAPQYSYIKNMTQAIQSKLPANGPRRGLLVSGMPCVYAPQHINLNETLPSCHKNSYAMVYDSAKEVITCGNPPLTKFKWHTRTEIESSKFITRYADTGWKTIGLVITNNSFCSDTVWYHNYLYIHPVSGAFVVPNSHICAGDTIKIAVKDQNQQAIQIFTLDYSMTPGPGFKPQVYPSDTFRYRLIQRSSGKIDTVTSTSNNSMWGVDDSPLNFNYLKDTIQKVIDQPGHFTINSFAYSRFGCSDGKQVTVTVGHYADFIADNNIICLNELVNFTGTAQYFLPFDVSASGLDGKLYWTDPVAIRGGRKIKYPEQMQWDLDGDGIIDYIGLTPTFKYKKPGSYTVTIYTRDSLGCLQKTVKKDFIKVIDAGAFFRIAPPGDIRYCGGSHFFSFIDSSFVVKSFKDSMNTFRITSWQWDFGDGTAPITILDSTKKNVGHVYIKNGDYIVTLIASTDPTGPGKAGCSDTFKRVVHILGPISKFAIEGKYEGCVPFTLKVRDLSQKAKVREWLLGDGTSVTSNGDSIVYLTYKRAGVYCPQLFVADTVTDQTGKAMYCADTFPAKCALRVYVDAINIQNFTGDTLACLGRDSARFNSAPDTGYTSWTLYLGNGDSITKTKPHFAYRYNQTGKYHLVLKGAGAKCPVISTLDTRVIDIKADFAVDTMKKDTPVFYFHNLSKEGVRYEWDFGDGTPVLNTTSYDEVSHAFQKSGIVNICLTAYNAKGCADKVCRSIQINTFLSIPNVFTPNEDGWNNQFVITAYGNLLYDLTIYNRWGQQVFHSDRKEYTWNGKVENTGLMCPEGIYYYVFKCHLIGEPAKEIAGTVTLLRK
jgi:gliding motility-associated-like protein